MFIELAVETPVNLTSRQKELLKEFDIKYDPQVVCPSDDALADRVFEAGLQLLVDIEMKMLYM